ncbi:tyrosine-type recombinase/integrase [Streptomyces sp. NBRC 109706]|uniref:tyrosine-type recombinase/integrase n=1 Tax=Streptomyces sp. NBRC 109706 TaxID=1550035 RepID=UPI000A62A040|nr:site-specific integrase [Streptomyces sp. NBRC 109706]
MVVALGYEHLRRHDLRHTGLTWMADAGGKVHVPRQIAGHRSLATTQRYLHPSSDSILQAGEALNSHLTARRPGADPAGPQVVPKAGTRGHLRVVR